MAIKENALPVSQSIGSGDYLRKVSSGGVSQQVPFSEVKDAVVTVDSAIDSESENPVQNKAIAAALDAAGTQTQQAIATAIQTEVTDRNSAISQAISTEVSNRNTAISEAVAAETQAREAADEKLAAQISSLIIYEEASGAIASFNDGADGLPMKSLELTLAPIQSGTGTPSPDNVRPISGYDSVSANVVGKNLLDKAGLIDECFLNGSGQVVSIAGWSITEYIDTIPLKNYVASGLSNGGSGAYCGLYDENKVLIRTVPIIANQSVNFATASNERYVRLSVRNVNGEKDTAQLELGSTATDYEPYQGQTYTATLPETVYGGTPDLVSGEVPVTMGVVDLGSLAWQTYGSGDHVRFGSTGIASVVVPPSADNVNADILCDSFAIDTATNIYNHVTDNAVGVGANGILYAYASQYATPLDFKTAVNGVYICYPLATPRTIQLTPQEIKTLLGTNNVWGSGDSVAVEYAADPKLYILKVVNNA